ncbi:MAG: Rieske 2Fe-2S domain-containing protein [Burkholderiales bacterium]
MLTHEQNDLICRTGLGTPGGDLMRRYWQPVALVEELPKGGAPIPVELLSEKLVLFRDENNRPTLITRRCPHRGADLSYGRVEAGGIRCLYHGWVFSGSGKCLEQPGEPAASNLRDKVKFAAYPCREAGGLIFAYMGPGDPPRLPDLPFLRGPTDKAWYTKIHHECNYLQGQEGNCDPQHLSVLHRFLPQGDTHNSPLNELLAADAAPRIEVEETGYGLRILAVRAVDAGSNLVRITNIVMPNFSSFDGGPLVDPKGQRPKDNVGYWVHWHVPINDESHWKYSIAYRYDGPVDVAYQKNNQFAFLKGGYYSDRTLANRFLQDREEMKAKTYAGLGVYFQDHDKFATESQGAISDRSTEFLGAADRAVILMRRMMLAAVEDVRQGKDPLYVLRGEGLDPIEEMVVRSQPLPASVDVLSHWWKSA